MVNYERGLKAFLGARVAMRKADPCVQNERVDLLAIEPGDDLIGELADGGQAREVELKCRGNMGDRSAHADRKSHIWLGPHSVCSHQPDAGCAARHEDISHGCSSTRLLWGLPGC